MRNKHDRRTTAPTPKAIVVRLVGDGTPSSYPHAADSPQCYLCGVTLPQDMTQDPLGGFHTLTLADPERHEPDCPWRMAYEYVNAHPKARKRLPAINSR